MDSPPSSPPENSSSDLRLPMAPPSPLKKQQCIKVIQKKNYFKASRFPPPNKNVGGGGGIKYRSEIVGSKHLLHNNSNNSNNNCVKEEREKIKEKRKNELRNEENVNTSNIIAKHEKKEQHPLEKTPTGHKKRRMSTSSSSSSSCSSSSCTSSSSSSSSSCNYNKSNCSLTPLRAANTDTAIKHCMHAFDFSLRDFDIGGPLGDGAHGVVFMARERRTQYICVLKCITKAHLIRCNQEPMLKKEIELQAHLKHPHIACMYTWFATPSVVFLVMEYCFHGDLFGYLDRHGPFSEERIAQMLFEITWAIRSCHDKRIAHLDLKPENILVNHRDKCKLADFGLSAHIGSKHGPVSVSRGTHDYWSPEQCARGSRVGPVANTHFGNYDFKTDIWTLGILAFELRFGFPPFGSTNEHGGGVEAQNILMTKIQKDHWRERLRSDLPTAKLSEEFESFLDTCLNKNPDKRPTADELLQHKFIVMHNETRIKDPKFISQPRPVTRGFNNTYGPFVTPRPSVCNMNNLEK